MTMAIWAIADLHLSFARPDRRERYAGRWRDHATKIERQWCQAVGPADLVLLPGDLSMARNHREVQPDLAWLDRLPGTKVLSAGNHDTWWNGAEKVRPLLRRSLLAVGGDAAKIRGVIVCGARGIPVPVEKTSPGAVVGPDRELAVLERALGEASRLRAGNDTPIYVLWHFPPFDPYGRPGPAVPLMENAGVSACVYGHLHAQDQWARTVQGVHGKIRYYCVAADAVGFRPLLIDKLPTTQVRETGPKAVPPRWTR
jgi:predicted phosphohydrolase